MLEKDTHRQYCDVLRFLGNKRLPYMILVDPTVEWSRELAGLNLPACSTVCDDFDDMNPLECIEQLVQHNYDIIVVVAESPFDNPWLLNLFNEVHISEYRLLPKQFAFCYAYDDNTGITVYKRALIDDTEIIALQGKAAGAIVDKHHFVTWQPWHTMLLDTTEKQALQIVWDTREIVGYGELSDIEFKSVIKQANANDNSLYLYDCCNLPTDFVNFAPFIADSFAI